MKKAYLNWSSGKDAAFALFKIRQEGIYSIEKLITTLNSEVDRISMHGVRRELLVAQAEQTGIPLEMILLSGNVPLSEYNAMMLRQTELLKSQGYDYSVFGDIFLEDLKKYREEQLGKVGITAVFPLWKIESRELMGKFIDAGFKAIVVCVNSKLLDRSYCGRILDEDFISTLPPGIDPCGENGEFHTFVYDGPIFKNSIKFRVGEIVERYFQSGKDEDDCFKDKKETWDTAFWYCDLIPE